MGNCSNMTKNILLKNIAALGILCGLFACGGSSEDMPEKLQSYGGDIEYKKISVPERYPDQGERQIELAVGVLKATNPEPGNLPLLILSGGPGDSGIVFFSNIELTNNFINTIRQDRDIILLDQRGTGYSDPALFCEADEDVATCRERLSEVGSELSAFNTETTTSDIERVLDYLEIPQVDIYSVSYGTFLAQNIMRQIPQHVRSVILDSTVPTTTAVSRARDAGKVVQLAFESLFADCKKTAKCRADFPNLENVFWALIARAKVAPVSITVTKSTGSQTYSMDDVSLISAFETLFVLKSIVPHLPGAIYALYSGESSSPDIQAVFGVETTSNSKTTASGDFRSVFCRDIGTFTTLEETLATDATLKSSMTVYSDTLAKQIYSACDIWAVGKASDSLRETVTSEIPTLILAGELDTKTDPAWGELVHRSLSNSYYFRFPRTGHGLIQQDCAQDMIHNFLQNPQQQPDSSCLNEFQDPDFYATN